MKLPDSLMNSLTNTNGFNREAFEAVHASGEQITSIRLNPNKIKAGTVFPFNRDSITPVPWTSNGYYLPERPSFTFDPLFHAGTYYVQEASSMFVEQALQQTTDLSQALKVLDLCAAPGGKSTHIQSLISADSLLVSNEVIRSRANILKDNIIKWGANNVVVTNNDPAHFKPLTGYFDVIVVDAPCSGSGLFRRDEEAIAEWSEDNVNLCSQRQQRILADIWPCLKEGGILIYSTCSFSQKEDETIVQWMMAEYQAVVKPITIQETWGIVAGDFGYRFWPDQVKGEGFFLACLQKQTPEEEVVVKTKRKTEAPAKSQLPGIQQWLSTDTVQQFILHEQTVYAWSGSLVTQGSFLLDKLKVIYSGTKLGELMRDKLIPDHALAMNPSLHGNIPAAELDYNDAIAYLQRKEINQLPATKGWQLATCQGYALGWMNVLPNRINNYYPKELRILKDSL
jgi:16S rRNA C967 or C1407 C5-methylase (RsmB/RsmF family)/NOL1/NOP2/fmu family ribosome biogenesis protein